MDEDLFNKIIIDKMTNFVNSFSSVDYERNFLRCTLNDKIAKFLTNEQLKGKKTNKSNLITINKCAFSLHRVALYV